MKKGKSWTKKEIEFLRNNPDMFLKGLSDHLGRSMGSIKQKRYTLKGATTVKTGKRIDWNANEVELLKENLDILSRPELAKLLNKTVNAVAMKIARIRGSELDKIWTISEDDILRSYWKSKNDGELAEEYNINQNTIRNRRIELGLIRINDTSFSNNDLAINPENVTELDKKVIIGYLGKRQGFKELAKILNRAPETIKSVIKDLGVNIPATTWTKFKNHVSGRFDVEMSRFHNEVIIGSLLGDGNLQIQTKDEPHEPNFNFLEYQKTLSKINSICDRIMEGELPKVGDIKIWNIEVEKINNINTACFRLGKSIQEYKWMQSLEELLDSYLGTPPKVSPVNNPDQKLQWKVGFQTLSSVQLAYLWNEWYIPKKIDEDGSYLKILPERLTELTSNIVLHWYTGDGSFSPNAFRLYTNNFSKNEQIKLQKLLENKVIEAVINKNQYGYFLGLSLKEDNLKNFFDYISQAELYEQAVKAMPYKFDKNFSHKEYLKNLLNEHPEFADPNAKLEWRDL